MMREHGIAAVDLIADLDGDLSRAALRRNADQLAIGKAVGRSVVRVHEEGVHALVVAVHVLHIARHGVQTILGVAAGGHDQRELLRRRDGLVLALRGELRDGLEDLVAVEADLVIRVVDVLLEIFLRLVVVRDADDRALGVLEHLLEGRVQRAEVIESRHLFHERMEAELRVAGLGAETGRHRRRHQRAPGNALCGGAPGSAERCAENAGADLIIFHARAAEIGEERKEERHTVAGFDGLVRSVVEPLGDLRECAGDLCDLDKNVAHIAALRDRIDHGRAQRHDALGEVHLKGVELIALVGALGGQDIVGILAVLRPRNVAHNEQIEVLERFFNHGGVRIGAHGRAERADRGADAVGPVREHLDGHDAGRERLEHGETIRDGRAPDLGIGVLVDGLAAGRPELMRDRGAGHHRNAADDRQHDDQIAAECAVAAAEDAEVLMDAPFFRGEDPREVLHLLHRDAGHAEAFLDVRGIEPGTDLIEILDVLSAVFLVLPAAAQNEGDQALEHNRVRAGTVGNVDVRHARGFAHARVDHDKELIGIFGRLTDVLSGVAHLVRDIGVGAPEHHNLTAGIVRLGEGNLIAVDLAVAPPVAEELKADGVENVLPAEAVDERLEEDELTLAAAGGAADAAHGAGAVLIDDGAELVADLEDRLIPGDAHELAVDALHRIIQTVAVVHEILRVAALAAGIAVGARAVRVGAGGDDLVVLHLDLQTAAHAADGTLRFLPFAHRKSSFKPDLLADLFSTGKARSFPTAPRCARAHGQPPYRLT